MIMERRVSSSERTPLLGTALGDDLNNRIGFSRALGIAVFMGLLIFIQTTNVSMMTTAQSAIAADFDAFAEVTWFTSTYMIAMSSVTPLTGRFSEIFTPRLFVAVSSTLLAIGLFISAAAPTLTVFLVGRAVAGCGSGGLMNTAIILVLDLTSPKRRGLYIGLVNAGYTTGVASGAVLAGLITPTLGWRSMFWAQAPVALILGPLLFLVIPVPSAQGPLKARDLLRNLARVDYAGALTLTISVVLVLSSLASSRIIIWPILLSLVFFAIFVVIESRWADEPVVPIRILRTRGVLLTCIASLGLMMARWSVLFYTPVYAMAVRGWSPASAGLVLVPTNAGFGLGGLLVGWLHIRKTTSYYVTCIIVFLLFSIAIFCLSLLSTPDSSAGLYLVTTFANGLFAGSLMNYTLSHLLHLTSARVHYIASALVAMSRGFAASFGSSIGGGIFIRILKRSLETGLSEHGLPPQPALVHKLLGSPATVISLTRPERAVAVESYEHAVRMLFLAGSALALVATAFQAGTGWHSGAHAKNHEERMAGEED